MADYAGDITPGDAWRILSQDSGAVLIDVRSDAEWSFVGLPDLSAMGKTPLLVAWARFPGMVRNESFVADMKAALPEAGFRSGSPLLFLCRSGARSRAAAIAATSAGFDPAYNIIGGFEGDLDAERHRGSTGGWKAEGLPWQQG
ncbi:rhodanese-like domain-containing protein [Zavarzinia compransoris]|uniref:rhodanese-like domain-containing protein n=1 Tax=Zavarzinia marina TaxID=2911065 RepID=UPI001F1EEF98|nr:rhodanese-like domain-containing protein [Zavarzinia marina]MCF4167443.1 rhodanese-like domain-containing protein [Zavarzinia marina]